MSGASANSWAMSATPCSRASRGEECSTGSPSTRISPSPTAIAPAIILPSVDLPAPLAPTSAWTVAGAIDRLTSSTARTLPYRLETARTSMRGAVIRLARGRLGPLALEVGMLVGRGLVERHDRAGRLGEHVDRRRRLLATHGHGRDAHHLARLLLRVEHHGREPGAGADAVDALRRAAVAAEQDVLARLQARLLDGLHGAGDHLVAVGVQDVDVLVALQERRRGLVAAGPRVAAVGRHRDLDRLALQRVLDDRHL